MSRGLTRPADPTIDHDSSTHGAVFWAALAVGGALMGWGAFLYLDEVQSVDARVDFGFWLIGADLVHDLLVVPLAIAVGWTIGRLVPGAHRPPIQAGVFASVVVVAFAWLPLHRTGAAAGNATIQPLDYRTSTLTALGLIWLVVGLWAVLRGRAIGSSEP